MTGPARRWAPGAELLGQIATFGLDHAPADAPVDWTAVDVAALWRQAVAQRLTGLLTARLRDDHRGGRLPEPVADLFEPFLAARAALLDGLELELVALARALGAEGIQVAAVKGPALGRSLYPEHWWRDFGDLDLLVRRDQFAAAVSVLEDGGARLLIAPPTRDAMTLLGKGVTLGHRSGFEIDLHHTLLAGAFGFGRDWPWWMEGARVVDIAGFDVTTTGQVRTGLHLLGHLCIGGPTWSRHTARDVAQALNAIDPESEGGRQLAGALAELGLDGLIQAGLARAGGALGWHHPAWQDWMSRFPPPAGWGQVEERFARQDGSFATTVRESWRVHGHPGDRWRILRAVAWPRSDHLRDRGLSRLGYLGRLTRR